MRWRGTAGLVVLLSVAALAGWSGEASAPQSTPLGERAPGPSVDFIAVQADGAPVEDLLVSEIEVRINGKLRAVRSLRRVAIAAPPAPAGSAPRVLPPYGTNDSVAEGRAFAIVVDQESFPAGNVQLIRDAVEGLLTRLTPADRVTVAALPFGGIRVPFTSEVPRIRLAVADVSGQAARAETGSDLACRTRRFLEALDGFLQSQSGKWSPLTVVLFTAGLGSPRRDAPMARAPGMCELLVSDFDRITATASAARANFYVVHPADIGMTGARWSETIGGVGYTGSSNPLDGIEHLAGVTGGTRLPLDATGTASLLRVARETTAVYVAELERDPSEVYGRSRSLAVRAVRRGITVRARSEITFADRSGQAGTTRLAIADLLASREAFPDLPLRTAGFAVREPNGRLRVGVLLEAVDPAVTIDSAGAVLIADDGRIVARWFASETVERPLLGAMVAPPGIYRLRVAAIDKAGRSGAAEDTIDANLTSVGPLSLGSLMLGVSRPEGVTPRLEFSSEPTALASFDIYGGIAGMGLSATLEIARDPDKPPLVTVPVALTRADASRVVASGAVPLGALPPGDYVVRGVIRLEDGTTGRVMRTLRKVAR